MINWPKRGKITVILMNDRFPYHLKRESWFPAVWNFYFMSPLPSPRKCRWPGNNIKKFFSIVSPSYWERNLVTTPMFLSQKGAIIRNCYFWQVFSRPVNYPFHALNFISKHLIYDLNFHGNNNIRGRPNIQKFKKIQFCNWNWNQILKQCKVTFDEIEK